MTINLTTKTHFIIKRVAVLGTISLLSLTLPAFSNADPIYEYTWNSPGANIATNDSAGTIRNISSAYDPTTQKLSWTVNFTGAPGTGVLPDAFHLVLSNGPNPKGHPGQLALFLFDATSATPTLSVVGYNGENNLSSLVNGVPSPNSAAPDQIASSANDSSWINSLTAQNNADGSRTLGFDINASGINNRTSPYTPAGEVWEGAQYGANIGIWFHSYSGASFPYVNGFACGSSFAYHGWRDASNEPTVPVTPNAVTPETNSLALLCFGLLGMAPIAMLRRRR